MNKANDCFNDAPHFEKGDYMQDGALYCGKCHTPKQVITTAGSVTITMNCACECEIAAYRKEEERYERERVMQKIGDMRRAGITDANYLRWTFAADDERDPAITAKMHKYVDNWEQMRGENIGLLLFGPVGTGKSFFAACIANALIDKGIPVMMTSFPKLAAAYYDDKNVINRIKNYELLVIDDLGVERQSEYMREIVFNVVDSRYRSDLPTIITTNLDLKDIKEPADLANKRIYSRILEMCLPLLLDGQDRRGKKKADKFAAAREIFRG